MEYEASLRRVRDNKVVFDTFVSMAEHFLREGRYEASAVCAQIAATQAFIAHTGIFACPLLENIVTTIGTNISSKHQSDKHTEGKITSRKQVLHVLNSARPTGGDTRYVWRLINGDPASRHSVVLTRQSGMSVPTVLSHAIDRTGGRLHILDAETNELTVKAIMLRQIAYASDFIFLHTFPDDTVPLLAFSDRRSLAPVLFVNHSDHTFWLGVTICDLFIHLRACGLDISERWRGIETERVAFLPTPLGECRRIRSRAQAKQELGADEDSVIILTIATAFKYKRIGENDFLDLAIAALQEQERALVLAIGPDNSAEWKQASEVTGGRVRALGRRSDTAIFFEAADIYADSFPFSSITSLLEAGSYGLPSIAFCPYLADARVLSSGAPGLDGVLLRMSCRDDYTRMLSRLIEDEPYRLELGRTTKEKIVKNHCLPGWRRFLEDIYVRGTHASRKGFENVINKSEITELDTLIMHLYESQQSLGGSIDLNVCSLQWADRVRVLSRIAEFDRSFSFSLFLPNHLQKLACGRVASWRRSALLRKFFNPQAHQR